MRHLIFAPLLILSLSGCHFFKKGKPAEEWTEMPAGEGRKVASSQQGKELYDKYDKEIEGGKCSAEVQQKLRLYGAERSWTKMPSQLDGSSTYVSPSRKIGYWVGVRKYKSGEMQVMLVSDGRYDIYSYSKTCSTTTDTRMRDFTRSARKDGGEEFDDKELEKLIARTSSYGVIYVWSPGMGYSYTTSINPEGGYGHTDSREQPVSGIKNAEEAMRDIGGSLGVTMTFTVLVDPFSPRALVKKAAEARDTDLTPNMLRRMTSFELQMRSMGQHYPSLLVYGNGKIFRQMRPGLTTAASYRKFIEDAVKALQQ